MKVEIITIGDELLIGQVTDTNATWIAHQLTQHGFEIIAISSVGDCCSCHCGCNDSIWRQRE